MYFTKTHEWVSLDGKIGTVGITDNSKKELGDIVYIELPNIGQELKAGEEACILESTKAAVDVYSPVSGKVLEINLSLKSNPALLSSEKWLFRLELSDVSECLRLARFEVL